MTYGFLFLSNTDLNPPARVEEFLNYYRLPDILVVPLDNNVISYNNNIFRYHGCT